jgi:hypothetical protein
LVGRHYYFKIKAGAYFLFICEVIVLSVILSSSASKNAFDRIIDKPLSPSNGRKRFSV